MVFRQAQKTNETETGQVYVNNFNDLTGLTVSETAVNNITVESPIGSLLPNTPSALTIDYTVAGNNYASVDLGTTYNELYVQVYVNIVNASTATSYTDLFKVGGGINDSNLACEIQTNHSATYSRFYSTPSYLFLTRRIGQGTWYKLGMHIDRVAQTSDYYIDGRLVGSGTTNNKDLQYITMGGSGDNVADYKLQFTGLTVNTDHFQEPFYDSNSIGLYKTFHIDNDIENHPDHNSNWTGLHSEPYSVDGGVTFIDGPVPYVQIVGTGDQKGFTTRYDHFLFKNGSSHKLKDLAGRHEVSNNPTGYDAQTHPTLGSYGSGEKAKVFVSTEVDPLDWASYDAPNNTYRVALTGIDNCTGAFIDEVTALRKATNLVQLEDTSGAWWKDSTYLYVRLWDDSDPSTHVVDASSNQSVIINDYGIIENLTFLHGKAITPSYGCLHQSNFMYASGSDINPYSIFRYNKAVDLWDGKDYGATEVSNPGFGLASSGDSGFYISSYAKAHGNIIEDGYSPIIIFPDSDNAVFAYNEVKNTIVNSVSFTGGSSDGDVLYPSIIGNNTILHSPRNINNDPYPLSRPQPGHAFVHQAGYSAVFKNFNNLYMLHFVEGELGSNSVMNLQSIINDEAIGQLGYNRYYMTPISTSPSEYFNQGDGLTLASWGTSLASYGDFKDMDGVSEPDSTSFITLDNPISEAEYTDTSGKWLATDTIPIETGDGFDFDYLSLGIYVDLAGNRITSTKNIGAK